MKNIATKLLDLGISLFEPPKPGGAYVSVNIRGAVAYVAIQFPIKQNEFLYKGRLGDTLTTQEGYEAAKLCAINTLCQLNKYVSFERIIGLNHLDIYYQSDDSWDEGPRVADGASEFFVQVLETHGQHTRSILGVHKLPRNFSVGMASSFTIS